MASDEDELPLEERHLLEPGREADRRARALDPNATAAVLRGLARYEPAAVLANPALPLLEFLGEWDWDDLAPWTFGALAVQPGFPEHVAASVLATCRRAWDSERGKHPGYWFQPDPLLGNPTLPLRLREQLLAALWTFYGAEGLADEVPKMGSRVPVLFLRAGTIGTRPPLPLSAEELELLWELGCFAHLLLAGHPDCPRERALALLESRAELVRFKAACRAACAGRAAELFRHTPDVALAEGLALNPEAPPELLSMLAEFERPLLTPRELSQLPKEVAAEVPGLGRAEGVAGKLLLRDDLPAELRARLEARRASS